MKRTLLLSFILSFCFVSAPRADTLRRADGTYIWDSREWRWDKGKFDSPPMPAGGYEVLVKQLSYPTTLRSRRIAGRSVARFPIDARGRVGEITFSPRMALELEQIVIGAVRRTRFVPARRAGKPVPSVARFPVTFVPPR